MGDPNLTFLERWREGLQTALVTRSGPDRRRSGFHPLLPFSSQSRILLAAAKSKERLAPE